MTHMELLTSWHQITRPVLRSIFLSSSKWATVRPTHSGDWAVEKNFFPAAWVSSLYWTVNSNVSSTFSFSDFYSVYVCGHFLKDFKFWKTWPSRPRWPWTISEQPSFEIQVLELWIIASTRVWLDTYRGLSKSGGSRNLSKDFTWFPLNLELIISSPNDLSTQDPNL